MNILSRVAQAMQTILTTVANTLGRESGFIRRQRKMSGQTYAQTLVLGWLQNPEATLEQLCQTAATLGIAIAPQSLDERFSHASSQFMEQLLVAAVEEVIATEPVAIPLLRRFNGVYLQDSTILSLPEALKEIWVGCGGSEPEKTASAVKLQVRLEILKGALMGPILQHGKDSDRSGFHKSPSLPQGALRLTDLGYFNLSDLKQLNEDNVYWLTRVKSQCDFYDEKMKRWDLAQFLKSNRGDRVEIPILLGVKKRLACRLLACRVSDEVANERRRRIREYGRKKGVTPTQKTLFLAGWTLLVTNVETDRLSLKEALVLMRTRWQMELLFKLWKTYGKVSESRSQKPWRILTEVSAKLLGMVIQHGIFLTSCWHYPNRSLMKASATVRTHASSLAMGWTVGTMERLVEVLQTIGRCLASGCRLNRRRKHPNTYQLLLTCSSP